MPGRIRIIAGKVEKIALLNDSAAAETLGKSLPLEATVNRWGDEIYFPISAKLSGGEKRKIVNKGDIAFWPPGNAFCIFFGPTPISKGGEIRPASEVIILGEVKEGVEAFRQVENGERIRIVEV